MTSKETLCSGCGATVTQSAFDNAGIFRDLSGSMFCEKPGYTQRHSITLPPVAIAPKAAPQFYIAAPFIRQDEARERARELSGMGFTVTSRWVNEDVSAALNASPEYNAERAHIDIEDIDAAQYFVLLGEHDSRTGGKHFETGYAYATGKKVVVVGRHENVFHYLPAITFMDSWSCFVDFISRKAEAVQP